MKIPTIQTFIRLREREREREREKERERERAREREKRKKVRSSRENGFRSGVNSPNAFFNTFFGSHYKIVSSKRPQTHRQYTAPPDIYSWIRACVLLLR